MKRMPMFLMLLLATALDASPAGERVGEGRGKVSGGGGVTPADDDLAALDEAELASRRTAKSAA